MRTWILDRLKPILGSDVPEPDALVVLTTVAPYEVPVIRQVLTDNGIYCHAAEGLDPISFSERVAVKVRQEDLVAANNTLAELRS